MKARKKGKSMTIHYLKIINQGKEMNEHKNSVKINELKLIMQAIDFNFLFYCDYLKIKFFFYDRTQKCKSGVM